MVLLNGCGAEAGEVSGSARLASTLVCTSHDSLRTYERQEHFFANLPLFLKEKLIKK